MITLTNKMLTGICIGCVGVIYAGCKGYFAYKRYEKLKKMENMVTDFAEGRKAVDVVLKKLDLAIDEVSTGVDICVDDMVVDEAIQRIANEKVTEVVNREVSIVSSNVKSAANASIRKAANETADAIKRDIQEELTKQISDRVMSTFDYFGLKNAVHKEGVSRAMEKLDGELDDISTKYRSSLDNAGKIYQKIAEKFEK